MPMSPMIVHVTVQVRPGKAAAFIAATCANARRSREEAGVLRFELLRSADDPERFLIVEVYRDADAIAAHKATAHYAAWRDTVADWMAVPRSSAKFAAVEAPEG